MHYPRTGGIASVQSLNSTIQGVIKSRNKRKKGVVNPTCPRMCVCCIRHFASFCDMCSKPQQRQHVLRVCGLSSEHNWFVDLLTSYQYAVWRQMWRFIKHSRILARSEWVIVPTCVWWHTKCVYSKLRKRDSCCASLCARAHCYRQIRTRTCSSVVAKALIFTLFILSGSET